MIHKASLLLLLSGPTRSGNMQHTPASDFDFRQSSKDADTKEAQNNKLRPRANPQEYLQNHVQHSWMLDKGGTDTTWLSPCHNQQPVRLAVSLLPGQPQQAHKNHSLTATQQEPGMRAFALEYQHHNMRYMLTNTKMLEATGLNHMNDPVPKLHWSVHLDLGCPNSRNP